MINKELEQELKKITGKDYNILTSDDGLIILVDNKIRTLKTPKKPVTAEWILNKTANNYKNLVNLFKKIKIKGNIYYTSFGFSYDMFFKSQSQFDTDVENIEKILKDNKINYRCEFSDARWVYRFIISKNKHNLNIIKTI